MTYKPSLNSVARQGKTIGWLLKNDVQTRLKRDGVVPNVPIFCQDCGEPTTNWLPICDNCEEF